MSVRILIGDCRDKLRDMPDASVNCCVTSPPYFGLRDYGTAEWRGGDSDCDHRQETKHQQQGANSARAGRSNAEAQRNENFRSVCGKCAATRVDNQMGLEPTPDEFVAGMVEVFREVRRVLRDDGTLWLNIGDSYCANPKGNPGERGNINGGKRDSVANDPATGALNKAKLPGLKQKDLIGIPWMLAFALRQPWTDWQIKDEAMRAWVAGIVDGEGCITIQKTKSSHCESLSFPPIVQVRMCDREPLDRLVAVAGSKIGEAQHPPSQVAANQRPSWQWKVSAERAAKIIAEIYPFLTCKRKQAIVAWNHQQFRTQRGNQLRAQGDLEREQLCKALINDLNQRRSVDLPSWMIEPKIVQEPGWYLRQDCIWSKPNPMPESVRDRCTKAHEYLFLLSKGPRYYFDIDAVAEPVALATIDRLSQNIEDQAGSDRIPGKTNGAMKAVGRIPTKDTRLSGDYSDGEGRNDGGGHRSGGFPHGLTRNKRSVWEVATQPFSEAHFATYPPALIEPCIIAGCPIGGTVLDPFGGAGTTGLVADRLGRDAILIELNPEYAEIAQRRLRKDGGMFAEVAVS